MCTKDLTSVTLDEKVEAPRIDCTVLGWWFSGLARDSVVTLLSSVIPYKNSIGCFSFFQSRLSLGNFNGFKKKFVWTVVPTIDKKNLNFRDYPVISIANYAEEAHSNIQWSFFLHSGEQSKAVVLKSYVCTKSSYRPIPSPNYYECLLSD